jgi:hypothetical protein
MNPLGSNGMVEKNPEIEGEMRSVLMTLLSIMMHGPLRPPSRPLSSSLSSSEMLVLSVLRRKSAECCRRCLRG